MSQPTTGPDTDRRSQPGLLMPQAQLEASAARLAQTYQGVFSAQTVQRYVFESYTALRRTAKVQAHLTVLAQRFATDRLLALAQAQGSAPKEVPEVLFVCVHNAGRSQMAAALLAHRAQGRVHVRSAGSAPAAQVNPAVAAVMAEIGLDLGREFPKPLTDDVVAAADVVVTMGCGDACPIYPAKRYLDWALADPEGADLATVRAVREDLDARVQNLLGQLTTPTPPALAPTPTPA